MNILGEGFPSTIIEQIATRQRIAGSGFNNTRPNSALEYYSSRTAWGKLMSSVNLTENKGFRYSGDLLAKKYVLFNGVSERLTTGTSQRAGISGQESNPAYGLAEGSTGAENEMGLRPMPGIMDISVKSENRGSLRTGEIKIKAWSRQDFEIIDALYLRVGFSLLLEWGWSTYYGTGQKFISSPNDSLEDEFLAGKYDYQEMLGEIQKKRIASAGNYDAMFGKVVNFSWSFQEDGSYDITVILKSVGDVIESLKINSLTLDPPENPDGNDPVTPPTGSGDPPEEEPDPSSEQVILDYANKHSIGTLFVAASYTFQTGKFVDNFTGVLTQNQEGGQSSIKDFSAIFGNGSGKTSGKVDFIKQQWVGEEDPPNNQYYVRLGSFLDFLQERVMMSVEKDGKKVKILNLDTDTESNLMLKVTNQISADPRICQFRTEFTAGNKILSVGEEVRVTYGNNVYIKIMNIYMNVVFLLNKLEELKDDKGKVGLIDFLNSIATGIGNATGNVNYLSWSIDEVENRAFIVDQTAAPDKETILKKFGKSIRLANFNIYGYYGGKDAGFVRNLSMKTEMTPDMATMITVGAQAGGYVIGEDATGLSVLNKGFKDRIKPSIVEAVAAEQKTETDNFEEEFKNANKNYQEFLGNVSFLPGAADNGDKPQWNKDQMDSYPDTLETFLGFQTAKAAKNEKKASPKTGFLPFNLSLTLDGLSGMKIYNKFIIDTSYLPSNYPTALEFIIKGLSHKISNNDWQTTVESFAIVKDPFSKPGQETPPKNGRRPPSGNPPGGPQTWTPPGEPAPATTERDKYYVQYGNPKQLGFGAGNSSPVAKRLVGEGYGNGKIPNAQLVYPGIWNGTKFVKAGVQMFELAAVAFSAWNYEIYTKFGYTIAFNSGYRSYARQVAIASSPKAAKPGRSAHGVGIALDLAVYKGGKSVFTLTNGVNNYWNALKNGTSGQTYRDISPIAAKYDIVLPWRMRNASVQSETWHWEYWGSAYYNTAQWWKGKGLSGKYAIFNK